MYEIKLTQGKKSTVDKEDYYRLINFKWHVYKSTGGRYYACRNNSRKHKDGHYLLKMHRVIMGLSKYDKRQVDHINGDSLDNRRCNLRIVTPMQNAWNRGAQNNSKSGIRGVYRHTTANSWIAQIKAGDKRIHIGSFKTPEEAKHAYNEKAIELYGEYARLND